MVVSKVNRSPSIEPYKVDNGGAPVEWLEYLVAVLKIAGSNLTRLM